MNVDEAMAKWKQLREHYCMPAFPQTIVDILAAEVERLRSELAAAKAASECPVDVLNILEVKFESDRYIELRTDADADTFEDWLRDRMKERSEG